MTTEEQIARTKKAINQAIKVMGGSVCFHRNGCHQGHCRTEGVDSAVRRAESISES